MNNEDIFQYAIENGIINPLNIQKRMDMDKRREILAKHPYKIWQGEDNRWYTYLLQNNRRMLKSRKTQEDIENLIVDHIKEQEINPTITEVFTEWNDWRLKLKKISPATHTKNLGVFNRHYKEFGKRKIANVKMEEFVDFLELQIPTHNLAARAFGNLKGITKGLIHRAYRLKYIDYDGYMVINALDVSDREFKKVIHEDYEEVFNEEEMARLMDYLKEHLTVRDLPIMLMFLTGMRIGEVSTLKPQDLSDMTISVRRTETTYKDEDGKRQVQIKDFPKTAAGVRDIVLPKEYLWVLNYIRRMSFGQEYVFMNEWGRRVTSEKIRRHLDRVLKKLDIYHKSPHKIRKTYGTILLDYNVDKRLILDQMGHSNIQVSENHYHRNRKTLEKKSAIISNIPEFAKSNQKTPKSNQNECSNEVLEMA